MKVGAKKRKAFPIAGGFFHALFVFAPSLHDIDANTFS